MTHPDLDPVPPWGERDDELVQELRAHALERAEVAGGPAPARSRRPAPRITLSLALAALAVVVLFAAAAMLTRDMGGGENVPVSALAARPTSAAQATGDRIGSTSFAEDFGIEGHRVREVASTPAGAVFAAPAAGDWLCVIYAPTGGALGTTCAPRATLRREPIVVQVVSAPGSGRFVAAGIAPDGYRRVVYGDRSAAIATNGFLLADLQGSGLLHVSGGGLPTLRAPIGIPSGSD